MERSPEGIWCFEIDPPVATTLAAAAQVTHLYRHARLVECNAALARLSGGDAAGLLGAGLERLMPRSDPATARHLLAFIESGYRLAEAESAAVDGDGRQRTFQDSLTGIVEGERLRNVWGTRRDVTERARAVAALRERESRFSGLFAAVDEGYCLCEMILDDHGEAVDYRFLEVNSQFSVMTGLPTDAAGKSARELVPDLEMRWVQTYAGVAFGSGALRFEDGSEVMGRLFDVFATPVAPRGRFALVFRDITARKRMEESLRRSEAQTRRTLDELRATYDQVPVGLVQLDTGLRYVRINDSLAAMNGIPAAAHIGKTLREVVPELAEEAEALARRVLETGEAVQGFELTGETAADPGVQHTWLESWYPLRDGEQRVVGINVVAQDITERKAAEVERERLLAQERAARAEAEAALRTRDEFISVAAHELKTPTTGLRAFAQLEQRRLRRGDVDPVRLERALTVVVQQADRLTRLTDALLDVARLSTGRLTIRREPTDLATLARGVVEGQELTVDPELHQLRLRAPDPGRLVVEVDPLRVEQVLRNLLDNAIKYSPEGGAIEVAVGARPGGGARLVVDDRGPGVPLEHRERIFERFYQADAGAAGAAGPASAGMGLGLWVSRQIAELHGGTLVAEFPPGGGARFILELPATPGA